MVLSMYPWICISSIIEQEFKVYVDNITKCEDLEEVHNYT